MQQQPPFAPLQQVQQPPQAAQAVTQQPPQQAAAPVPVPAAGARPICRLSPRAKAVQPPPRSHNHRRPPRPPRMSCIAADGQWPALSAPPSAIARLPRKMGGGGDGRRAAASAARLQATNGAHQPGSSPPNASLPAPVEPTPMPLRSTATPMPPAEQLTDDNDDSEGGDGKTGKDDSGVVTVHKRHLRARRTSVQPRTGEPAPPRAEQHLAREEYATGHAVLWGSRWLWTLRPLYGH